LCLKVISQIYKEKQGEFDDLMVRCDKQLKNDESSNSSDSNQDLQSPLKTLPIRYIIIIILKLFIYL
jgi:hypothetical protein